MNAHDSHLRRPTLTLFVAALYAALVLAFGFAAGTAQSPQDADARPAKEEREVEDKIPAHLPLKIKLKKPEKVKDLGNDRWLADLELEVTNTGTKPIYYLAIAVFFKDVKKDSGNQIGYQMHYGRGKMVDVGERATPEDVPIPPGGTHVFKLHEDYVKGWNWYRTRVEKKPHPRKVGIRFDVLNHGDGTGYLGPDGTVLPNMSSAGGSAEKGQWVSGQATSPPNPPSRPARSYLPATFSPVNFFAAKPNVAAGSGPPQSCCTGMGVTCERMKLQAGGNCFCPVDNPEDGRHVVVDGFQCNDPLAACRT